MACFEVYNEPKWNLAARDFSQQWEVHRKDLTVGHWTNMTLVGVSSDGNSNSVKVKL